MSAEDKDAEIEVNGTDDKKQKKASKHDGFQAADLEQITDYVEEKEISAEHISSAVEAFGDKSKKEAEERLAKERELLKVQVKKEDIDLIVNEMLINRQQAEKVLREQKGDVVAALEVLIST